MPPRAPVPVRRRALLAGGLSAGATALLLAACSGDDDGASPGGPGSSPGDDPSAGTGGDLAVDPAFTLILGNNEFVPGEARVAIAILRNRADGTMEPLDGQEEATVGFAPIDGRGRSQTPTTFVPLEYHDEGLPATKTYYSTRATFTGPGPWEGYVRIGDTTSTVGINVIDPAAPPYTLTPDVGAPAPRVPTPTLTDTLGVDPICTRTDDAGNPAVCALHDVSLSEVIGAGTPVVVSFSTPARCQSQVCGPTLEMVLVEAARWTPDQVRFVHCEIYQNNDVNDVVAAIDGSVPGTWSLVSEPWLFAVDGGGVVRAKLEGVFDGAEIRALVETVAPS